MLKIGVALLKGRRFFCGLWIRGPKKIAAPGGKSTRPFSGHPV
ncbi:MAG TPA: hypothetical protein VI457_05955 [Methylococcaceae bacterium]|nr:hypothetical protein [Methylococcaceae bacterium]